MNLQGWLKQSTQVTITILMVDSSDHVTGKTGLAAGLTIYASKAGAAPAAITPTVAELDATNVKGVYSLVFTTTHTNTVGEFQVHITATGADPTDVKWQVTARLPDDLAYPATSGRSMVVDAAGLVDANCVKLGPTGSGTAQTAKDVGAAVPAAAAGASGGLLISGSNSGTTTLGALTVTGATTLTGNVVLSDGLTISAPSTLNRAGVTITGNGTGAGIIATAGATGIGFNIVGGGTSGDGIKVTTTSGHGINLAPVGTSKHGFFSTGGNGGTSDGMSLAAGTGGVDLRAGQTGNLTGNVSGSVGSVTARVTANADQFAGQTITAAAGVTLPSSVASPTNITAATGVDVTKILGTAVSTPATAGILDVNVKNMNNVAGTAITTIKAVQGLTTADTITTVTNLTNAATAGDFTATMKTSLNAATPTVTLSAASVQAVWDALTSALTTVGSIGKRLADYVTGDAYARLGAPAGASVSADIAAVKGKTDSLTFTAAGKVDADVTAVNSIPVGGSGTDTDPWGPA